MKKISFNPVPVQSLPLKQTGRAMRDKQAVSFSDHLDQAVKGSPKLTLSKHASKRLEERGIRINERKWSQIEAKVFEAKQMGVKESLVLLEDAALIVSAKNNTVITAMNRREATSQIFTNINGAIVLE